MEFAWKYSDSNWQMSHEMDASALLSILLIRIIRQWLTQFMFQKLAHDQHGLK